MILNSEISIAVRVNVIRTLRKVIYRKAVPSPRHCIEVRYTDSSSTKEFSYGTDKDARDADFDRLNSAMDALDGIQQ